MNSSDEIFESYISLLRKSYSKAPLNTLIEIKRILSILKIFNFINILRFLNYRKEKSVRENKIINSNDEKFEEYVFLFRKYYRSVPLSTLMELKSLLYKLKLLDNPNTIRLADDKTILTRIVMFGIIVLIGLFNYNL